MTFLDDLPETAQEVHEAEVIPIRAEVTALMKRDQAELEKKQEQLRSIEDELFRGASETTADALAFREIEPGWNSPPDSWIAELGEKRAWQRFRVAQSAWMSAKEAPVALKIAQQVTTGMLKNRTLERVGRSNLNVAIINVGVQKDYGEPIDVTGD